MLSVRCSDVEGGKVNGRKGLHRMQEGEDCAAVADFAAVAECEVGKVKLVDVHKETLEEGGQLPLSGCVCKITNV